MSTQTELEIVSPGAFASLQDGGRHGFRRIGVPWAGVLDRRLMRIANALAGRDEHATGCGAEPAARICPRHCGSLSIVQR